MGCQDCARMKPSLESRLASICINGSRARRLHAGNEFPPLIETLKAGASRQI